MSGEIMSLVPVTLSITPEMAILYGKITFDKNPIHLDEKFASTTPYGAPIAHGTCVLNVLWLSLEQTFSTVPRVTDTSLKFIRAVKVGDTVSVQGIFVEPGKLEFSILDSHDAEVIVGSLQLEVVN